MIVITSKKLYRGKLENGLREEVRMKTFHFDLEILRGLEETFCPGSCLSKVFQVKLSGDHQNTHKPECIGDFGGSIIQLHSKHLTIESKLQWFKLSKPMSSSISAKGLTLDSLRGQQEGATHRRRNSGASDGGQENSRHSKPKSQQRRLKLSEDTATVDNNSRLAALFSSDVPRGHKLAHEAKPFLAIAKVEDFQNKLKEELKRIELRYQNNPYVAGKGNSQESFHDTNSSITINNSQIRKKIDSMLTEWNDQTLIRPSPKPSKYESIRQLIEGQSSSPVGSRQLTERNPPLADSGGHLPVPEPRAGPIDKKTKLAMIKASLNKIDARPSDMFSNKETIEYEFSDGEFSDADQADPKFKSPVPENEIKSTKKPSGEMIEEVQEESDRHGSMIYHSQTTSNRKLDQFDPEDISQNKVETDVFNYQVNEIEFEEKTDFRKPRGAYRIGYSQISAKPKSEDIRIAAQVLEQKLDLIFRIKRRNAWRQLLDQMIDIYVVSIEDEKTDQCHEILRMLACEVKRNTGFNLLTTIKQIQHLVKVDNFGQFLEEKMEIIQKREALEQICQFEAEEEDTNLLDAAAIRKIIIIGKTIVHQKRYILFHKVFGIIKQLSEEKKSKTKLLISALSVVEKRMNKQQKALAFKDLTIKSKLEVMVDVLELQFKSICMKRLTQYKHDRSFLACTASDITLVRDDSMEISKSKFDRKFHLPNSLYTQQNQVFGTEEDRPLGFQRNKRHLHQNTLEDIRNELSHMNGRKLEDYSGFSKKSDLSKGKANPSNTSQSKKGCRSPDSEDKNAEPNRVFTNERLNMLVANVGIKDGNKPLIPLCESEPSYQSQRMRSTGLQEKLIEIQLIDNNSKEPHQRATISGSPDLPPLDKFKKHFKTEEAQSKQYSLDLDDNFEENIRPSGNEMKEKSGLNLIKDENISPKVETHNIFFRERESAQTAEIKKPLYSSIDQERLEFNQEPKEMLTIASNLDRDGSLPNLIKNIKSNFTELQKIYQQGTTIEIESDQKNGPNEPSAEEFGWADKNFHDGYNFIVGTENTITKHTVKKALGKRLDYAVKNRQEEDSPHQSAEIIPEIKEESEYWVRRDNNFGYTDSDSQKQVDQEAADVLKEYSSLSKPPLGFTKTQLSFRSFFKKLEKGSNDKKSKPNSASMVAERGNESLLNLISPVKQPSLNQRTPKAVPQSREKDTKKSTTSLTKIVKSAQGGIPSFNSKSKHSSLVERLQNHILSSNISTNKDHLRQVSREVSNSSTKLSNSVKKTFENKNFSAKNQDSKEKNLFKSSLSDKKRTNPLHSERKPAIKIKDSSRSGLENSSGRKHFESERSPNRPPLIPKSAPKANLMSSQVSNQSIEKAGPKKVASKLNSSMKSTRTLSAKSDTSRKLDNSNEDYKTRYHQIRGQLKTSSNYVKIAEARKQYNVRSDSPFS